MVIVRVQKPEYTVIEPGEYLAALEKVSEHTGKYGPMLRFHFRICQGEPYEGLPVTLACSAFLSPGNKLDKLLQELGASDMSVGDELDLDRLADSQPKVKTYVENFKDKENVYNNVTKVRKLRDHEAPAAPAATEAPAAPAATEAPAAPAAPVADAPPAPPAADAPATNVAQNLKPEDVPF